MVKKQAQIWAIKLSLRGIKPEVWRRIELASTITLADLHQVIQTAMGWTNSHLHHFRIGEQLYGDPMLMAENFEDMEYEDSVVSYSRCTAGRHNHSLRVHI